MTDDGSIPQDAGLLRRIHPIQVVSDENSGEYRPSSAAFRDIELSVDAEPILLTAGLDWHFTLKEYPSHSLVRFRSAVAREKDLAVVPSPQPGNPAHTLVVGKKTQSKVDHIRRHCEWVFLNFPATDKQS